MRLITLPQISQMVGRRSRNTGIIKPTISILSMVIHNGIIMCQRWTGGVRKLQSYFTPIHKNGYTKIQSGNFPINRGLHKDSKYSDGYTQSKKIPPAKPGNNFGSLVKIDQFVHKIVLSICGSVYHETRLEREQ